MPSTAPAIAIVVIGLSFAAMGVAALVAPARMLAPFGVTLVGATGRAEVRAVYGGFGLAVAAVLGLALSSPELRGGIVVAVAAALAGMAFGRLVSRLVDRPTAFYPNWFYCLVEAAAAAVLVLVARG